MIYPFADKLENMGAKYSLVVLAAKRAKQIKSGVQPSITTDSRNPLTIALEEIAMGKIQYSVPDNDMILVASEEPEVAQLLAIPGRDDEGYQYDAAAVVEEETPLRIEDDGLLEEELEEWEESDEEDEVIPLDKHLENGIPIISDDEDSDEEEGIIPEEEPKPKSRGRRKSQAEPEPDIDIDLGIDPDIDVDIDDIEPEDMIGEDE